MPLFADGVNLVKNDDVQLALVALLFVLALSVLKGLRQQSPPSTRQTYGKERSNVLFGLTDVFIEDFRSVDELGLACVKHLSNFARDKRLASSGWPVKQHTCNDQSE